MVDKNINIIYRAYGAEQVAAQSKKIAEGMIPITKQSKTVIEQIGKLTKSTTYDVQTMAVQNRDAMGRFASGFTIVNKEIEKNIRTVEDHRQRFKMYLLSIMFFGMIIQRTFQKMAETTLGTFMKITEAQTTAGQAVSALSAHWEYLKFSVGEAIASFIEANPWIIELIDSIADFVQQNGQLIATLTILGIAFGGTIGLIGQLGLGISGLSMGWKALVVALSAIKGTIAATDMLAAVEASAMGATTATSGLTVVLYALIVPILLIIATLAALWLAWQTNFGNIRQTIGTMVMGIQLLWNAIEPVFRNIGAGAILLANIVAWAIGNLGYDWEAAWLGMYRGASIVWNAILGGIQILINGFEAAAQAVINLNNWIVKQTGIGQIWADVQHTNVMGWMADTDAMKKRLDELGQLMAGGWNLTMANVVKQTQAWDAALQSVSPALKAVGLGMIQSGESYNALQEAKLREAAPQQDFISRPGMQPISFSSEDTIIGMKQLRGLGKGETTVNIEYNVTGNTISSSVDLKQALREHNDEIMNTLKSYGISR